MKQYNFKQMTVFIFDLKLGLDELQSIEDYIYTNLYNYDKYELICLFNMLETRRGIERRGFRSHEELTKEWKSKLI